MKCSARFLFFVILLISLVFICTVAAADVAINSTNFPDAKFRSIVQNYDTNNNGSLSSSEIADVTWLNCSDAGISSLKGVEFFSSVTSISCYGNNLTSLDVSDCSNLETLNCHDNKIASLTLTGCTSLKTIECYDNQIKKLNVSGKKNLEYLSCSYNQLSALDVSDCPYLETLYCYNNKIVSLTLTGCTSLKTIECYDNQIKKLNVSGCSALLKMYCYSNYIRSLNISGCDNLEILWCEDNSLSWLDLSRAGILLDLVQSTERVSDYSYDEYGERWSDSAYLSLDYDVQIVESIDLILPSNLKTIGDDTFSGIKNRVVKIPSSVTYISETAFHSSTTVICTSGSYAESRCLELGLTVLTQ